MQWGIVESSLGCPYCSKSALASSGSRLGIEGTKLPSFCPLEIRNRDPARTLFLMPARASEVREAKVESSGRRGPTCLSRSENHESLGGDASALKLAVRSGRDGEGNESKVCQSLEGLLGVSGHRFVSKSGENFALTFRATLAEFENRQLRV